MRAYYTFRLEADRSKGENELHKLQDSLKNKNTGPLVQILLGIYTRDTVTPEY